MKREAMPGSNSQGQQQCVSTGRRRSTATDQRRRSGCSTTADDILTIMQLSMENITVIAASTERMTENFAQVAENFVPVNCEGMMRIEHLGAKAMEEISSQ